MSKIRECSSQQGGGKEEPPSTKTCSTASLPASQTGAPASVGAVTNTPPPHGAKASISGAAVSVEPDCHGVAGAGEGSWDGVATELLIIPFHTIPFVDHLHII